MYVIYLHHRNRRVTAITPTNNKSFEIPDTEKKTLLINCCSYSYKVSQFEIPFLRHFRLNASLTAPNDEHISETIEATITTNAN